MPQPYKGVRIPHTIRLPADLHRAVVAQAKEHHWSVNEWVVQALLDAVPHRVSATTPGARDNRNVYDDEGRKVGTS